MVDYTTIKAAIPIFERAFPGCQALFAFNNPLGCSANLRLGWSLLTMNVAISHTALLAAGVGVHLINPQSIIGIRGYKASFGRAWPMAVVGPAV